MTDLKVKKGSFRGIEFHFDGGSTSGGRRGTTHQYPFREDHYDEDLGKRATTFRVSGYLEEPDIRTRALELQRAFETPGHGVYYDAWRNREWLVRCTDYTIDASRGDLGTITFSASFVERGAEPAPSALRRAFAALNGILSDFNDALATGYNLINGTSNSIGALIAGFQGATSYFSFGQRRFSGVGGDTISATGALAGGSPNPGAIELVQNATDAVIEQMTDDAQIEFLDYMTSVAPTGVVEADNQALLFAGVALDRYAEIIIRKDFANQNDAVAQIREFMASVASYIDLAESLGQFEVARLARCLSSLVGDRVSTDFGDTPIVRTTDGAGLPAIVLSHRIYGDIDAAKALMEQNCSVSGASMKGQIEYIIERDGA